MSWSTWRRESHPMKQWIKPFSLEGPCTAISNILLDEAMQTLSPAAWKVVCAAVRWAKYQITYPTFLQLTGIRSKTTLRKAIQEALKAEYIVRRPIRGHTQFFDYAPTPQFAVDVPEEFGRYDPERLGRELAAKRAHTQARRRQFAQRRNELVLALIERDGYECKGCATQDDLTLDHVVPISRGGSDDPDNLQLLCQSCNSRKRDQ